MSGGTIKLLTLFYGVRTFVYRKSDCPEGKEFYTLVTQGTLTQGGPSLSQEFILVPVYDKGISCCSTARTSSKCS